MSNVASFIMFGGRIWGTLPSDCESELPGSEPRNYHKENSYMASTILTQDTVFALLNSKEEFPVNFEDAWQWCEFATKGSAKRSFERVGFEKDIDYTITRIKKAVQGNRGGGATHYDEILLNLDTNQQHL